MKANHTQTSDEIVLMEDDPAIRELLIETLEPHPVHSFENGKAALEWFENHPAHHVALVISDDHMPGLSGLETMMKIRALAPDLKFVLMSGTLSGDIEKLVRQNHLDGCLHKPFALSELEQIVETALAENDHETSPVK